MNRRNFVKSIVFSAAGLFCAPQIFKATPQTASVETALQSNHRSLIDRIRHSLEWGLEQFTFENNTDETRYKAREVCRNILDVYLYKHEIYAHVVVCDESVNPPSTIDENKLKVQVYLQIQPTIEYTVLDIEIAPQNLV
jgi:hypothetical protein